MRFLADDVAIANKRAWATDAEGRRLTEEPAMQVLYVLKQVDGRWWISARAHTLVA